MSLYRRQRRNGCAALYGVEERAHNENWDAYRAHHMAVLVTMCQLAESYLWNYGNWGFSDSAKLADKIPRRLRPAYGGQSIWMGTDHDSVGTFQQRSGWGTIAARMDVKKACHAFMARAADVGVDDHNGLPNRLDVQAVQVSFDMGGWNYQVHLDQARAFVHRHWDFKHKRLKRRFRVRFHIKH